MPAHSAPADELPCILLLDDEQRSLETMRRTLEEEFRILCASSVAQARETLARHSVDVILCDQRMPDMSGVAFLKEVRDAWPDCVRIVISGYSDSEDIIAGINEAGIFRYVLKPWLPEHLLDVVRSAVQARSLQHEVNRIELDLRNSPDALRARRGQRLNEARALFDFERIARAPGSPLDGVCAMAERLARHDISVLVQGESGSGKELLARAIHYASPRQAGPFVVENCAAITDSLLESELFGHKRGAFTGAFDDHVGLFQRAHKGTLFLDEIGETSAAFQVKLLRVLQEGEVRPVGAARAIPVDVRIVCATHRNLEADVQAGRFREDLYYRLAETTLTMPPLRERVGDIATIAAKLLQDAAARLGRGALQFSNEALSTLMAYPWPGNIRELRNEIGRAVALSDDTVLGARAFSTKVLNGQLGRYAAGGSAATPAIPATGTLAERLEAIEAVVLRECLLRHQWNKTRAAEELGLSRVGLRAKLARLGLDGPIQ
ncbi:MAG: sigma-54-dependent Fis family transcriptional regulator [Rhodoferax sp.]|nr:sigma-54-dependent Fis family transcriptional regulator [Rhodoferax sp.]